MGLEAWRNFRSLAASLPPAENLVVVDQNNQLIRFVTFTGEVSNLAGIPGVIGGNDGPGNNATFSFPNGIVADTAGNLYVADEGNDAIRRIDTNNNVSTVPVGNYKFSAPAAVALDTSSNIWVADTGHDVICLVSNSTVTVVGGVSGFPGDNDSPFASVAHFNLPSGLIWSTAINGLLISDTGNDTLRELFLTNFNGSQTYSVQTIAGNAEEPGFIDGAPTVAKFNGPTGLAIDSADSGYFVADAGNNAVRIFEPNAPQAPVSTRKSATLLSKRGRTATWVLCSMPPLALCLITPLFWLSRLRSAPKLS